MRRKKLPKGLLGPITLKDVARVRGVQGLDDEITVNQPRAWAAQIASAIARAAKSRKEDQHG